MSYIIDLVSPYGFDKNLYSPWSKVYTTSSGTSLTNIIDLPDHNPHQYVLSANDSEVKLEFELPGVPRASIRVNYYGTKSELVVEYENRKNGNKQKVVADLSGYAVDSRAQATANYVDGLLTVSFALENKDQLSIPIL